MFFKKTVVMLLLSSTSYSSCRAQRGAAIRMSECYVFNISLYVSGFLVFVFFFLVKANQIPSSVSSVENDKH